MKHLLVRARRRADVGGADTPGLRRGRRRRRELGISSSARRRRCTTRGGAQGVRARSRERRASRAEPRSVPRRSSRSSEVIQGQIEANFRVTTRDRERAPSRQAPTGSAGGGEARILSNGLEQSASPRTYGGSGIEAHLRGVLRVALRPSPGPPLGNSATRGAATEALPLASRFVARRRARGARPSPWVPTACSVLKVFAPRRRHAIGHLVRGERARLRRRQCGTGRTRLASTQEPAAAPPRVAPRAAERVSSRRAGREARRLTGASLTAASRVPPPRRLNARPVSRMAFIAGGATAPRPQPLALTLPARAPPGLPLSPPAVARRQPPPRLGRGGVDEAGGARSPRRRRARRAWSSPPPRSRATRARPHLRLRVTAALLRPRRARRANLEALRAPRGAVLRRVARAGQRGTRTPRAVRDGAAARGRPAKGPAASARSSFGGFGARAAPARALPGGRRRRLRGRRGGGSAERRAQRRTTRCTGLAVDVRRSSRTAPQAARRRERRWSCSSRCRAPFSTRCGARRRPPRADAVPVRTPARERAGVPRRRSGTARVGGRFRRRGARLAAAPGRGGAVRRGGAAGRVRRGPAPRHRAVSLAPLLRGGVLDGYAPVRRTSPRRRRETARDSRALGGEARVGRHQGGRTRGSSSPRAAASGKAADVGDEAAPRGRRGRWRPALGTGRGGSARCRLDRRRRRPRAGGRAPSWRRRFARVDGARRRGVAPGRAPARRGDGVRRRRPHAAARPRARPRRAVRLGDGGDGGDARGGARAGEAALAEHAENVADAQARPWGTA